MAGSFVDTTILVEIAEDRDPGGQDCKDCLRRNTPAQLPNYALKEYFASRVQALCIAHNKVHSSSTPAEAILAVASRYWAKPRIKDAAVAAIAVAMKDALEDDTRPRSLVAEEVKDAIALKASEYWTRAQSEMGVLQHTQPLACFVLSQLDFDTSGALVPMTESRTFNCTPGEACSAAAYIADNLQQLRRMLTGWRVLTTSPEEPEKRENATRRKALKDLERNGAAAFPRKDCRSIGDAYFAAMCPPGSVVVTTNISDHQPLCAAVGKEAKHPRDL